MSSAACRTSCVSPFCLAKSEDTTDILEPAQSFNVPEDAVASITQPVLLLHGDCDRYNSVQDFAEWQQLFTGAQEVDAHIIPGTFGLTANIRGNHSS